MILRYKVRFKIDDYDWWGTLEIEFRIIRLSPDEVTVQPYFKLVIPYHELAEYFYENVLREPLDKLIHSTGVSAVFEKPVADDYYMVRGEDLGMVIEGFKHQIKALREQFEKLYREVET